MPPDKTNQGIVDAIEAAVSRLNAAKANLLTSRDEHSRKVAARTYNAALRDLNRRVYELYNLSEKDICLIEEDEAP